MHTDLECAVAGSLSQQVFGNAEQVDKVSIIKNDTFIIAHESDGIERGLELRLQHRMLKLPFLHPLLQIQIQPTNVRFRPRQIGDVNPQAENTDDSTRVISLGNQPGARHPSGSIRHDLALREGNFLTVQRLLAVVKHMRLGREIINIGQILTYHLLNRQTAAIGEFAIGKFNMQSAIKVGN